MTSIDTATRHDSTSGLSETCRSGLEHLLSACADTKLLLGYHYGEWTFGTPEIEAAVASCSLSQAELGHVRLLHAVLKRHYDADPDALMSDREAGAFANVAFLDRDIAHWADFVAMNLVVDLAVTRVLDSLRGSSFKPIHMSVEKMLDEERYHAHHGFGWFRALARRNDETRTAIEASLNRALASVIEWFGPADDAEDRALIEAGIRRTSGADTLSALIDDLSGPARELGVTLKADRDRRFDGWDPATRRCTPGAPDEQILYHLRGSKNAVFKVK